MPFPPLGGTRGGTFDIKTQKIMIFLVFFTKNVFCLPKYMKFLLEIVWKLSHYLQRWFETSLQRDHIQLVNNYVKKYNLLLFLYTANFKTNFKISPFLKKLCFFLIMLFFCCKNILLKIRIYLGKTILCWSRSIYVKSYTKKVDLYRLR